MTLPAAPFQPPFTAPTLPRPHAVLYCAPAPCCGRDVLWTATPDGSVPTCDCTQETP